ncbi:MAG: hypothetical protein KJ067_05740 [Vicinamibacteria bacterium]|nr:hypothetical protein [Vicinamibacteria bacterium]
MARFAVTFVVASAACLAIYLVQARLSGERRISLPVAPAFFGFFAALAAHLSRSVLGAGAVVLLYAAACASELRAERRMRAEAERRARTLSDGQGAGPGPGSGGPGAG